MKDLILSVDCGTQSLRTFLFDFAGKISAFSKIEYEPYVSVQPGWAEQDVRVYWKAFLDAIGALRDQIKDFEKRVAAITVTTLSDTMVNVDKSG
ncbi:FGGY family carbohydrate kinase, partial [Athalassotoga sp.]